MKHHRSIHEQRVAAAQANAGQRSEASGAGGWAVACWVTAAARPGHLTDSSLLALLARLAVRRLTAGNSSVPSVNGGGA